MKYLLWSSVIYFIFPDRILAIWKIQRKICNKTKYEKTKRDAKATSRECAIVDPSPFGCCGNWEVRGEDEEERHKASKKERKTERLAAHLTTGQVLEDDEEEDDNNDHNKHKEHDEEEKEEDNRDDRLLVSRHGKIWWSSEAYCCGSLSLRFCLSLSSQRQRTPATRATVW